MSWLYDKLQKYRETIMYSAIPAIFAISTIGALSGKNEPIKPNATLEEKIAKTEKKKSPIEDALFNKKPEEIDWDKVDKTIVKLYTHERGSIKMLSTKDLTPSKPYSRRFNEYDKKHVQEIIDEYYNNSRVKQLKPQNPRDGVSYWRSTPARATVQYEFEVENNRVIAVHHTRMFTESKSTYDLMSNTLTIQPLKASTGKNK